MTYVLFSLMLGCTDSEQMNKIQVTPETFDGAECSVCSMIVAEQPSPRAQVIYRDGTRHHLCSLADLSIEIQTPSSNGKPIATYVESLPSNFDPKKNLVIPLPWINANDAVYILGFQRPRVMGTPILSFSKSNGQIFQSNYSETVSVDWKELINLL
jgi:nitrous oxide reductase accessory protein NosL